MIDLARSRRGGGLQLEISRSMRQLLVVLLLVLCGPALSAPHSIEGFSSGGSADEIVSRIGEPTDVQEPVFNKKARTWVWRWDYSRYGALFEVEAATQDSPKSIRSLTIVSPCPWKLDNGLGIGDSTDRLLQMYTDVHRADDTLWFVEDKNRRDVTGFELNGSRIKSIYIGTKK
jgi:hypothetical protein